MSQGRVITVSLDLSSLSRDGFSWAVSNLYRHHDLLVLVNVAERAPFPTESGARDVYQAHEAHRQAASQMLDDFSRYCASNKIRCEAKQVVKGVDGTDLISNPDGTERKRLPSGEGDITRVLEAVSKGSPSSIFVVAYSDKDTTDRMFFGATSDSAAHHAHVPVVILKRPFRVPPKANSKRKIGVCVDSSEQAQKAFDWVTTDFYRENDSVFLIHLTTCGDTEVEADTSTGEALMTKYSSACIKGKIDFHTVHARSSKSPPDAIVDLEDALALDCVVVGSRGRGSMVRSLFGSFSDAVLKASKCDVIVVK